MVSGRGRPDPPASSDHVIPRSIKSKSRPGRALDPPLKALSPSIHPSSVFFGTSKSKHHNRQRGTNQDSVGTLQSRVRSVNLLAPPASFFSSLPFYDTSDWGQDLEKKYGHDAHLIQSQEQRQPPQAYIPPADWWQSLARNIRRTAYRDGGGFLFSHLQTIAENYLQGEHGISFDHRIMRCLPTTLPGEHACVFLYAALTIELARYGTVQTIDRACHSMDMACDSYSQLLPFKKSSRGLSSTSFVATAIHSATEAGQAIEAYLGRAQEQQLREDRAKQASTKLWADWAKRDEQEKEQTRRLLETRQSSASTIQRWARHIKICQRARRCVRQRLRRQQLCRGASTRARTIKLHQQHRAPTAAPTNSPTPTNNPKPNPNIIQHPFRNRALPLPKRKRRQRNHRLRTRPPRNQRRNSSSSTPNHPSSTHRPNQAQVTKSRTINSCITSVLQCAFVISCR